MTYPQEPGYQKNSETSRNAAEKLRPAKYIEQTMEFLKSRGVNGATADELAQYLSEINGRIIQNTTAGARLTELLLQGTVLKSGKKRATRFGRDAEVIVLYHPSQKEYTYQKSLPFDEQGHI